MISTFFGIEIARRGLMAGRNAMDVTAHNLANASTEGYTRQDPVFSATDPYTLPNLAQRLLPGQLGTGTEVAQIRRIRDALLDGQVRDAKGEDGFWQARQDALQRVEAVFPEPSDVGLESVLARFFDAWHELNNNPGDLGLKAVVKEAGEELAVNFRHIYRQLSDIEASLRESVGLKVDRINEIANELGELNKQIARIVANGNQPNDLLDRRDVLLDELAAMAETDENLNNDGTFDVNIYGEDLVTSGGVVNTVSAAWSPGLVISIGGVPVNIDNDNIPGSISGIESARRKIADPTDGYLSKLDTLAKAVRDDVNGLHDDEAGNLFFDNTGTGAGDLYLSSDIDDVINVAGTMALDIARLREDPLTAMPGGTYEAYYRGLVSDIGASAQGSGHQAGTARAVLQQLENLRQSVSGVSVDEELTRLVQFQYAYQASARVMTVLDSMLDTLINRMGVL
ncbi:MAG: flagellar hook-associated protein FlgK [Bacillota bacterium]